MELKNNLEKILKDRGIKKSWLANKAGISESSMSNMTKNRHNTSLLVAFKICRYLNLKIEDLFYLDESGDLP